MGVLVNKDTKVIVQGITGNQGRLHTEKMLEYGCTEALNLDGGDTVALAFNNKLILHGNMEAKKLRNLGSMIAFGLTEETAETEK